MRIIFVRHGHPDYKNDCLTELGHEQAKAAGERLKSEGIDRIYSSTMGRAVETSEHIAEAIGYPKENIVKLDFMREIEWDFAGPWEVSGAYVEAGESIMIKNWESEGPYARDRIVGFLKSRADGFDTFLATLGYKREGLYYRVTSECDETIVVVSHAGTSTGVLSRLFNLPATFLFDALRPHLTAVTVVMLKGKEGQLVSPRFEIANDSRHVPGI